MAFYETDMPLYEERASPANHLMDSMMMMPTQGELGSVSSDTGVTSGNSPLKNVREQILLQQQEGSRFLHERSLVFSSAVQSFKEFIESNDTLQKNLQQLYEIARKRSTRQRYILDLSQLDSIQSRLIREDPMLSLPSFERALREHWDALNAENDLKQAVPPPAVGVIGWMGANHITPRGLTAQKLDRLVCVEGVVNKCSPVHPKLQESVYVRESTAESEEVARSVYIRPHYDITDFDKTARDAAFPPANDVEGKIRSKIEIGFCQYKDHQKFVVQECPESAPTGQMTRWVDVIAEEDLCNKVKSGDRVRVWGVYRMSNNRVTEQTTGIGKPYLIANNLQLQSQESTQRENLAHTFREDEIKQYLTFSKRKDVLTLLSRSFAPSLCGLETIKKALLLLICGGEERTFASGHHIRGDIHILLVGDPSCGKSQLLRYVMNLQKGTISAGGKGSSGVGLTAAIVTDQDTGERRVEGGAMVLADRHIICIDEFDKMNKTDRVAIHEVMEQQTVTVAKAGIRSTLNARCSVVAVANPIYGCWTEDKDFSLQLNFEDALLSRFDLIFFVRDCSTEKEDAAMADAVLRNITTTAAPIVMEARRGMTDAIIQSSPDLYSTALNNSQSIMRDGSIFASRHEMVYLDPQGEEHAVLRREFLMGYLNYAKFGYYNMKAEMEGWSNFPELSEEVFVSIPEIFADIRQKTTASGGKCCQSITTRTLEAIIRLSTAHARLHLKRWVIAEDVSVATSMLLAGLFQEDFVTENAESSEDVSDSESQLLPIETVPNSYNISSRLTRREKRTHKEVSAAVIENLKQLSLEENMLGESGRKRPNSRGVARQPLRDTENAQNFISPVYLNRLHIMNNVLSWEPNNRGITSDQLYDILSMESDENTIPREQFERWLVSLSGQIHNPPILYSDGMVYPC